MGKILLNNTGFCEASFLNWEEMWWNDELRHDTHFPSSNEIFSDDESTPFVGNFELSKWVETFWNKAQFNPGSFLQNSMNSDDMRRDIQNKIMMTENDLECASRQVAK